MKGKLGQVGINSEDYATSQNKRKYFIFLSIVISFLIIICIIFAGYYLFNKKVIGLNESTNGFGNISGFVYSPNGNIPLSGVKVYVDDQNNLINFTDDLGSFSINFIPSGKRILIFEQGSFKNEVQLTIQSDTNLILSGNDSIRLGYGTGSSIVRMAVVRGSFDSIENILDDLGFKELSSPSVNETGYVLFKSPNQIINNLSLLNKFSILFMNCGTDYYGNYSDYSYNYSDYSYNYSDYSYNYSDYSYNYSDYDYNYTNIQNFIKNGGSFYASDWEYYFIEKSFPKFVDFGKYPKSGQPQEISAKIISPSLVTSLGKDSMQLIFDMGQWVIIRNISDDVEVVIRGNISDYNTESIDVPLMIIFNYGLGKVLYTSFHNEEQKTEDMDIVLKKAVFNL
jgi:hypothetical protein